MRGQDARAESPNATQIEYWNQVAGPKWVGLGAAMDRRMASVHELLLAALDIEAGHAVLDVGCGMGTTTLACAERTGAGGSVLGIDISRPMLEVARERVGARGLSQVSFVEADAESHPFAPRHFDRVVSRFGVMFFADPTAAFRNLHAAMRAGGRMTFVCWAPLADNPHWRIPLEIAREMLGVPRNATAENAPGPLALSDRAGLQGRLEAAGLARVTIATKAFAVLGATPEEEAGFACRMGPAARLIEERTPDDAVRQAILEAVAEAFRAFACGSTTRLPAAVHLVTAEG